MERNIRNINTMQANNMNKRPAFAYNAQHDEVIKYIYDAWHKINESGPHGGPTIYQNPDEQRLVGFQPFDLESYWGRRKVQNINITRGLQ